MSGTPRLQPLTRAKVASLGETGAAWAAALPDVLADLERQWRLQIGRPMSGGSASYVVAATRPDQTPAVVKIAITDEGLVDQVATLERAQGRGYARLLAYDLSRQALLLEALGTPLERSERSPADQLRTLADTLGLAWQDADGRRPPAGADKATQLHQLISGLWERLGRPCSEQVVDQALGYAERLREVEAGELVIVHGDPHAANLLHVPTPRPGAETGYCFVDPDGFVADRAYDLGVAVRDWTGQLAGGDARSTLEGYCRLLAERTGVDAQRIWEWGFVERVSTGLYVLSFGADQVAEPYLRTAEALV